MIKSLKNYQYTILFSLLFTFTSVFLNTLFSRGIALFLVLSLGIIHGANDIKLLQKKNASSPQNNFFRYLLIYIGVVLLGVFVFYRIPHYGLLAFVLVSSYHFGEQHLESSFTDHNKAAWGKHFLYFFYGATIFGLLFYLQSDSVIPIIKSISGITLPLASFRFFLLIAFFSWAILMLFIKNVRVHFFLELIVLAFFGSLFLSLDLLEAFALYFVFWHSIPSIQDQMHFLYGTSDLSFFKTYIYDSLVYWLLALFGLGFVYFFIPGDLKIFLPLFFSFLAAITFPHAVVMALLQLGKRSQEGSNFNANASLENK